MRRIVANDNDDNTDTSTYVTSVTNVSDVDALVMMPGLLKDLTANGKTPLLYFRQCETWANPRVKEK